MGRWQPDAAGRLQGAALALFDERGYDETTVAAIAARAGLSERTFFRHFADKREVLFGGSAEFQQRMVDAVDGAPPAASAMEAITLALQAPGATFDDARRRFALRRQAVIDANPELAERELVKLESIAAALAEALRRRGVRPTAARLAADAGIAAFRVTFSRWAREEGGGDFADCAREAVAELQAVTAAGS
jgi:AcrR family transcriptional regulator